MFVFLIVFPVVTSVESHVTVESGDVLELPGADAALHHVLDRVGLGLGDGGEVGRDDGVEGCGGGLRRLDGHRVALLALSDELFQQLELGRVRRDLGDLLFVQRVQSSKY